MNVDRISETGQTELFACQDNRMGVPSDGLPRPVEEFVRGGGDIAHIRGTGLGLYFARMVIENMHGQIWAKSDGEGKGSTFLFSLPVAASIASER